MSDTTWLLAVIGSNLLVGFAMWRSTVAMYEPTLEHLTQVNVDLRAELSRALQRAEAAESVVSYAGKQRAREQWFGD